VDLVVTEGVLEICVGLLMLETDGERWIRGVVGSWRQVAELAGRKRVLS
jgi:hypothetical protein